MSRISLDSLTESQRNDCLYAISYLSDAVLSDSLEDRSRYPFDNVGDYLQLALPYLKRIVSLEVDDDNEVLFEVDGGDHFLPEVDEGV